MRIVFMGTPEFAVPSLDILVNAGYDIAAVITSPDKWGGRGRKTLIESAVKLYAKEKGLPILQPTNLKSETFVNTLRELKADLQIVVAFRMLPVVVWNMPPLGTYNLHGSLLPKYRGAAPINWAIMKGEKTTGVTSFKLKHEIDTGSILLQRELAILDSDNATNVHDRMMYLAADVVLESTRLIESGNYELKAQSEGQVSHAPKLNKDNTEIDFQQNCRAVYNFIRGLSLYPGAWFDLKGASVKVYDSKPINEQHSNPAGFIESDNKEYIRIACSTGWIEILELKYPGKKLMPVKAFLNGFKFEETDIP